MRFKKLEDKVRFERLLTMCENHPPCILILKGQAGSGKSTLSRELLKKTFKGTIMIEPHSEIINHNSRDGCLIIEV